MKFVLTIQMTSQCNSAQAKPMDKDKKVDKDDKHDKVDKDDEDNKEEEKDMDKKEEQDEEFFLQKFLKWPNIPACQIW